MLMTGVFREALLKDVEGDCLGAARSTKIRSGKDIVVPTKVQG